MKFTKNCPETTIIFTTYGRVDTSKKSLFSLVNAIKPYRDRVKIIVVDSTNNLHKVKWINKQAIDDLIWAPQKISAATSRNLGVKVMMEKYSSEFVCFVEDDVLYSQKWYDVILKSCKKNYGKISPFQLAYGIFTACSQTIIKERTRLDKKNNLIAYIFGAVADQRFMPLHHYLSVLKDWDSDVLGISYTQTGMQTARNTMRGFCGGIIPNKSLCKIIQENISTWEGSRDPGPQAHSFNIEEYKIVMKTMKKIGQYEK